MKRGNRKSSKVSEQATKTRIVQAAEELFAEHGMDGVSFRRIGMAAGQSNNSVIPYHFKDKVGLINAILEYRMVHVNERRQELFDHYRESGEEISVNDIMRIMWLPFIEETNKKGQHVYAKFLMQYVIKFQYYEGVQIIISEDGTLSSAGDEITHVIFAMLSERLDIPKNVLVSRMNKVVTLLLVSLISFDSAATLHHDAKISREAHAAEAIEMMIAVLSLPYAVESGSAD